MAMDQASESDFNLSSPPISHQSQPSEKENRLHLILSKRNACFRLYSS